MINPYHTDTNIFRSELIEYFFNEGKKYNGKAAKADSLEARAKENLDEMLKDFLVLVENLKIAVQDKDIMKIIGIAFKMNKFDFGEQARHCIMLSEKAKKANEYSSAVYKKAAEEAEYIKSKGLNPIPASLLFY